ncbi:MAG TPA: hypothetical protein VFG68_14945 [Fimbriiglobus sp.]|nr:hypothetical protein [Fimbriiglobus sp.]
MPRCRCVLLAVLATSFTATRADPLLTDAEAATILKAVRPAAGEDAYARVPWLTSLWEARKKAAAEGKPILLWEMDGHPLGCG